MYSCEAQLASWSSRWSRGWRTRGAAAAAAAACAEPCRSRGGSERAPPRPQCPAPARCSWRRRLGVRTPPGLSRPRSRRAPAQATQSGFWITALYSDSPQRSAPATTPAPAPLWSCRPAAPPGSGCQLGSAWKEGRRVGSAKASSPAPGSPAPRTHQATARGRSGSREPSRTTVSRRSSALQPGAPSPCQTQARDLGVPGVLQRPPAPARPPPPRSHPRGRLEQSRALSRSSLTDSGQTLQV